MWEKAARMGQATKRQPETGDPSPGAVCPTWPQPVPEQNKGCSAEVTRAVGCSHGIETNECIRCQGVLIKNLLFQMEPKSQRGVKQGWTANPESAPWLASPALSHCIWGLISILTTGRSLSLTKMKTQHKTLANWAWQEYKKDRVLRSSFKVSSSVWHLKVNQDNLSH